MAKSLLVRPSHIFQFSFHMREIFFIYQTILLDTFIHLLSVCTLMSRVFCLPYYSPRGHKQIWRGGSLCWHCLCVCSAVFQVCLSNSTLADRKLVIGPQRMRHTRGLCSQHTSMICTTCPCGQQACVPCVADRVWGSWGGGGVGGVAVGCVGITRSAGWHTAAPPLGCTHCTWWTWCIWWKQCAHGEYTLHSAHAWWTHSAHCTFWAHSAHGEYTVHIENTQCKFPFLMRGCHIQLSQSSTYLWLFKDTSISMPGSLNINYRNLGLHMEDTVHSREIEQELAPRLLQGPVDRNAAERKY